MKKIFIVMINYGDSKNTIECLDSFLKLQVDRFSLDVVVVDNLPSKRIEINAEDYKKLNLFIVFNEKNTGFSGGMNTGIKYALGKGADYVLIHNNDTLVKEDFLEKLFDFMEKDTAIGIASPKIYFAKGYEFHKNRYKNEDLGKVIWYAGGVMDWQNVIGNHNGVDEVDHGQFDTSMETDFATGCSMIVRKEVFEKVGMFDEKYFLYYEDNDLCQRAKKQGFKNFYISSSIIWHKNAGSTGGSGSTLQDYFITRNRLYFGMKYASVKSKIALLREAVNLIFKGRNNQKKGAIDFLIGKMGRGSLGL